MQINSNLHVVIVTCDKYLPCLPVVIEGLKNIENIVISKTIVSPNPIHVEGFNNILDEEIWKTIDSNFKYQTLYDTPWYRQQILKLALDNFYDGNVLLVDGDVVIVKPVKFIENNKFNFYMLGEYYRPYFNCLKTLTGLTKRRPESFISEVMVFNTDILKELKHHIKEHTQSNDWLDSIYFAVKDSLTIKGGMFSASSVLSEFELYGSYMCAERSELINKFVAPYPTIDWRPRIDITESQWKNYSAFKLYELVCSKCPHVFQSIRFL
jgi:hypothetical protein